MLRAVAVVSLLAAVAGCTTTEEVYVQEPLPLPERPEVPTVPADELKCLDADVYADLAERDAALRGHISRLEQIIQATHEADE